MVAIGVFDGRTVCTWSLYHTAYERLLIPYKRSQDRDPYDTTNLPAHIQHARCYP